MSGLHISLLTLRALISTTVCRYVWGCVCVHVCLCMRGWINVLRSVSVYCMEVCVTYTFVTMSTCLRLPAASIQCPLTPSHCRGGLTRRRRRKWWEKDGESHLTVAADLLMCKNANAHTRTRAHTDVNTWNLRPPDRYSYQPSHHNKCRHCALWIH